MSYVQKRDGKYRARYKDPLGKTLSRTFARKADAQRFLLDLEFDRVGGRWVDPRDADTPVAVWAEEWLSLCRRLAERTQETYRRDLSRFVLPRFGSYRLGHLPADEIENWLMDEIDSGIAPSSVHRLYRTLRRMLQVALEKQKILTNPCDRVDPPRVPKREMTFLDWDGVMMLADAITPRYPALVILAVDSGMPWSELVGLRRSKLDLGNRKVRVTEQLVRLDDGTFDRKNPRPPPAPARSRSRRSRRPFCVITSTITPTGVVTDWSSRTPLADLWRHRASSRTTSARPAARSVWRAGSTISATPALHWLSRQAPTRRPSRRGWATARSTSPSTATATSSPNSTPRSPTPSAAPLCRLRNGGHRSSFAANSERMATSECRPVASSDDAPGAPDRHLGDGRAGASAPSS